MKKQSLGIALVGLLLLTSQALSQGVTFELLNDDDEFPLPAAAVSAFNEAGRIWGNLLTANSPDGQVISVRGRMESLGPDAAAGAISNLVSASDHPFDDTWYQTALSDHLRGASNSFPQFEVTFNSDANWYYGTDRRPGSNQLDLMSVAVHEFGHGLGFSTGVQVGFGGDEPPGAWKNGDRPNIWDRFLQVGSTDFTSLSESQRFSAAGSDNVFWNGANGRAAFFGARPKIDARDITAAGTSLSHFDPTTHGNDVLSSNPAPLGAALPNPSLLTLGVLSDMGWNVRTAALGDSNGDFVTDILDLQNMSSNYSGPGDFGLGASEGDTDFDSDVDSADINNALRNAFLRSDLDGPTITYFMQTGDVYIDPLGLGVNNFVLIADETVGGFADANFSMLPNGFEDETTFQIGWTSFDLAQGMQSEFHLGSIPPAGLNQDQVSDLFARADFGLVTSSDEFGGGRFQILVVPEPNTGVIVVFSCLLLSLRRSRLSTKAP